jgi:hypothetical protein
VGSSEPPKTVTRSRGLARACRILFAVSTMFPIVASLLRAEQKPRWLGLLDVAMAAMLAACAMLLATRNRNVVTDADRVDAFRHTQLVLMSIPILLALFLLLGDRLNWHVLVVGLAWRGWLLIVTLPYLAAARDPR